MTKERVAVVDALYIKKTHSSCLQFVFFANVSTTFCRQWQIIIYLVESFQPF